MLPLQAVPVSHRQPLSEGSARLRDAGDAVEQTPFELARDRLLVLRDAQGTTVSCETGSLWITDDQRVTDLVLSPGASFIIGHRGLILVMALERSSFRVSEQAADGFLRGVAKAISRWWRGRVV